MYYVRIDVTIAPLSLAQKTRSMYAVPELTRANVFFATRLICIPLDIRYEDDWVSRPDTQIIHLTFIVLNE